MAKSLNNTTYIADEAALKRAKWITHPKARENVLLFEKPFCAKNILSARLVICGLGFFEGYLNGKRIDERFFMPAFTDYEKRDLEKNSKMLIGGRQRVFVHSYDVTELLKTPLIAVLPDEYEIYEGDLEHIHTAFRFMAHNLVTGKKRLYDVTKKYGGFWGNVRRALKRRL